MSSPALPAACAAGTLLAGIAFLRRRFLVVPVTGTSMAPGIGPDDRVVVWRGTGGRLRVGMVVLLWVPPARRPGPAPAGARAAPAGPPWLIKRVAALPGDRVPEHVRAAARGAQVVPEGKLVVLADNPGGSDSRQLGFMRVDDVYGRVVHTLPAASRR